MNTSIFEHLKTIPDQAFHSLDNDQIKHLMVDVNMAGYFEEDTSKPTATAFIAFTHPTHFVMIIYYQGYEGLTNNGYACVCEPKTDEGRSNLVAISEHMTGKPFTDGHFVDPINN